MKDIILGFHKGNIVWVSKKRGDVPLFFYE